MWITGICYIRHIMHNYHMAENNKEQSQKDGLVSMWVLKSTRMRTKVKAARLGKKAYELVDEWSKQ
jgi:hypothetical protein